MDALGLLFAACIGGQALCFIYSFSQILLLGQQFLLLLFFIVFF
jgi:hypothetical protein